MKLSRLIVLFAAAQTYAWKHASEAELRKAIAAEKPALVAFVLPDEDRTASLEPEFLSLQKSTKDHRILSFNCDASPSVCIDLDIHSIPTIRLYNGSHLPRPYRGPRKAASMASFLRRMQRPPFTIITEENRYNPELDRRTVDDVVIDAYIGHDPGADDYRAMVHARLEAVAEKYADRYTFLRDREVEGHEVFLLNCRNNVDGTEKLMPGWETVGMLEEVVKECAEPLIPELTRRNELQYYARGKSIVHYYVDSEKDRLDYVGEMRELARKYMDYLQFTTTDVREYPDATAMMGLGSGSVGGLSVQNPSNGDVFPYRGGKKITPSVVEAFLLDIIDRKVQPWDGQEPREGHDEL